MALLLLTVAGAIMVLAAPSIVTGLAAARIERVHRQAVSTIAAGGQPPDGATARLVQRTRLLSEIAHRDGLPGLIAVRLLASETRTDSSSDGSDLAVGHPLEASLPWLVRRPVPLRDLRQIAASR